jgi:hypothetical protein
LIDALWCLRTAAYQYRKNDVLSSTKHVGHLLSAVAVRDENEKNDAVPKGTTSQNLQRITDCENAAGNQREETPIWLRLYRYLGPYRPFP